MNLKDTIQKELCNIYCPECTDEEKSVLTEAADPNTYSIVIGGKEQKIADAKTFEKTILSRVSGDKNAAKKQLEELLKEGGEAGFTIRNGNKLQSVTAKVELGLGVASRKDQRAMNKADKMATKLDSKYKFAAYLENGVVKIYMGTKELIKLPNGTIAKQAFEPMMQQIEKIIEEENASQDKPAEQGESNETA